MILVKIKTCATIHKVIEKCTNDRDRSNYK